MAKGEFVSFREFAERLFTSETTVRKAIASGKITEAAINRVNPKRPKLNFEKAKADWAKNFTPRSIQNQKQANVLTGKKAPEESEEKTEPLTTDEEGNLIIGNDTSYTESLRVEKLFKAKTAQLEYNEARGTLISRDAAYKEYYAIAQAVRSAIQAIPDKVIDHIIAADNRTEAHTLLYNELTEALEQLSRKPQFK